MTDRHRRIAAARHYLGWTQEQLAHVAGLPQNTISYIERDTGRSIHRNVVRVEEALAANGIRFTPHGIERADRSIVLLEGTDWVMRLLHDVELAILDTSPKEMLITGGDERVSPPAVAARFEQFRRDGIRIRMFIEEGNDYMTGPLEDYRIVPSAFFTNWVTVIYADKVAVEVAERGRSVGCVVIQDACLARSHRRDFEHRWSLTHRPRVEAVDEAA